MGRIFPHVLAYPDQNAEKSCKGGGGEGGGGGGEGEGELSRIEHAAKQQLKIGTFSYFFSILVDFGSGMTNTVMGSVPV